MIREALATVPSVVACVLMGTCFVVGVALLAVVDTIERLRGSDTRVRSIEIVAPTEGDRRVS